LQLPKADPYDHDVAAGDRLVNKDVAVEVRNAVKAFGQGDTALRALDNVSVDFR
jgi:hypothetical protein